MADVSDYIRYLPDYLANLTWEDIVNLLPRHKTEILLALPVLYFTLLRAELGVRKLASATNKFPGVAVHWLFGSMSQFPGPNEAGIKFWSDQTTKYPRAWKFFYGRYTPALTLCHPDTVKVLLKTTEPKPGIKDRFGAYFLMYPWLGNGLITSMNPEWFRDRRLLTPAFHFEILKPYVEIFNRSVDKLLTRFEEESKDERSVEIFNFVSLSTLDSILKCAMSYEEDVLSVGDGHPYVQRISRIASLIMERFYQLPMWYDTLYYLTAKGREFKRGCKYVHKVADDVIRTRKETMALDPSGRHARHKDFLDILLLARDDQGRGLTDTEIRDQVDTFLFAGHDTTASAISWCLYTLAGHVNEQDRCREEIQQVCAAKESPDITMDNISKLPHLTRCIKEALRIHCPVPFVRRESTVPLSVDGVQFPPGMTFDIITWCIHHNPTVWGTDHMEFKPERFLVENIKSMDPFGHIPFSAGPRNCIGQNFAMNEIKVFIARILTRFELDIDTSHPVEYLPEVVMRAKHGIKLYFKAI